MTPTSEQELTVASSGNADKFARVRDEANKLKTQAANRARNAATSGKEKATTTLDGLAQTVHEAATQLEAKTNPQIAHYAHRAADALDSLSATLRRKDIDELIDDARDLVRRNPAIAIGAAVAAGFILSRFLKATSPTHDAWQNGASAADITTPNRGNGANASYHA